MAHALCFVLHGSATGASSGPPQWSELLAQQHAAITEAQSLRIFRCPPGWDGSLDELVSAGRANAAGDDPFEALPDAPAEAAGSTPATPAEAAGSTPAAPAESSPARRLLCSATIPRFAAERLWLSVYDLESEDASPQAEPRQLRLLDSFPLAAAANETCWFFPTDDGRYLSCATNEQVRCLPGFTPELRFSDTPFAYDRAGIKVLWSLMADEESLRCVGLTYERRRVDFPLIERQRSVDTTWMAFQVDSQAEHPLQVTSTITTFQKG
jgi:hypothetical protein